MSGWIYFSTMRRNSQFICYTLEECLHVCVCMASIPWIISICFVRVFCEWNSSMKFIFGVLFCLSPWTWLILGRPNIKDLFQLWSPGFNNRDTVAHQNTYQTRGILSGFFFWRHNLLNPQFQMSLPIFSQIIAATKIVSPKSHTQSSHDPMCKLCGFTFWIW